MFTTGANLSSSALSLASITWVCLTAAIPIIHVLISETAFSNKQVGRKTVHDHYLSPQFVGRMILDHPDQYLTDFGVFRDIFYKSCGTIIVTAEENIRLSHLTNNDGDDYKVYVPTDQKYQHLGINLLSVQLK